MMRNMVSRGMILHQMFVSESIAVGAALLIYVVSMDVEN